MTDAKLARKPIITIDGPAGAGKSTVARHLAARFGLLNLESGAMYRAFARKALDSGVDPDNPDSLEALARTTTIELEPTPSGNRVLLDGADVTASLRNPAVTQAASRVSVHPAIRTWMVDLQRAMGTHGGIVMEGRDIGTVVFPYAEIKIFLDASPEARTQRRYLEAPSATTTQEAIREDILKRDERDRNRAESPMRPAPDAIMIDSTELNLDEVLARIESIVTERLSATASGS
jgi:cytidylate kinase